MVEPFDQCDSLLPRNVAGTDFLSGVIGGSPNAKFYSGGVVVKIVDAIINTVVLGVRSGGSFGGSLESTIFHRVVVTGLRVPLQIIAEIVDLTALS